jgi:hypothetical protein
MAGEDARLADGLADLIMPIHLGEEALKAFSGDVVGDVRRIEARPRLLEGVLAEVGGEDLQGRFLDSAPARSSRQMAIEYTYSPVAHPGTHTRMGASGARSLRRRGKTCSYNASKTAASRKKDVTVMRQS